jgi:excisionase family DNA binding protein
MSTLVSSVIPPRRLLAAGEVAEMLGCSARHVIRQADLGKMPWGRKVGRLRRWDVTEIEAWIAGGCKPVRGEE